MRLEKDLMLQVRNFLASRELTGEVLWHGRLNSLKVRTKYGGIIQGCPVGTPDWVAIVKANNEYELKVLFIECKSSTGILRPSQTAWIKKYGRKSALHILVLREIQELQKWFNTYAYDFTKDLPSDLSKIL